MTACRTRVMPRDYYEVLGVGREAARRRDQEGVPRAGARAAPGHQPPRPRGGGEVQGGRRGVRGVERPGAPRDLRPLRARRPAQRRLRAQLRAFGDLSDIFEAFFGGGDLRLDVRRTRARSGQQPGRDVARAGVAHAGGGAHRARRGRRVRRHRAVLALQRQRCRARDADRDLPPLRGHRAAAVRGPHGVRPGRAHAGLRPLRRRRPRREDSVRAVPRQRLRGPESRTADGGPPGGHRRRSACAGVGAWPRRRSRAGRRATSTCW